ncbi:MAG TPA: HAD-IC family P-type ATPase [Acidimicrobiales bacterium]
MIRQGLSADEVAHRVALGQVNGGREPGSRTLGEILRANLLTRFNFILGALLAVILVAGRLQDALFGIVLVTNALIGIVQEVRAKRTLDRLSIISAPSVRVIRDGHLGEVAIDDVVLDDLIDVRTGDQIVADGEVIDSTGLQIDESLLTGESDPVDKSPGARVLSGSFVVAGSGLYQATAVGQQAYARKLTSEAKRFSPARSELIDGINRLLRYISWAIPPAAALLVFSQLQTKSGWRDAVSGAVAGLVGMVPQGLVLLTSIAFGVAAVTLAARKVLVQQLPAVEGLARVDVVCFDKTGTLTDGSIRLDRIETVDGEAQAVAEAALAALAQDENRNSTLAAIGEAFPSSTGWRRRGAVPFSSSRKWSAADFGDHGIWVLGAPEIILSGDHADPALSRAAEVAATGERVVALARSDGELDGERLPPRVRAVALVVLSERIRSDAADTLAYFAKQNISCKVISGDNAETVATVAARAGLHGANAIDARSLPDDNDGVGSALETHSVFGRVTPRQKEAMVKALQMRGHTVAMTGDGVNDALALKLADIGIAMGSGTPATKAVAEIVLLDDRFATLPDVVAEGRQVIANIERVANTFITKTVWATVLAIGVSALVWPYPFLPRHLTIIDSLTIGVPSFFLALAPNQRRYVPGFIDRVLRFAVPAGIVLAAAVFAGYSLAREQGRSLVDQRTSALLIAMILSFGVLLLSALPVTWRRSLLLGLVSVGIVLLFPFTPVRKFFAVDVLPAGLTTWAIVIAAVSLPLLYLAWTSSTRRSLRSEDQRPGGS